MISCFRGWYVIDTLARAAALAPDIVVFTGDFLRVRFNVRPEVTIFELTRS